MDSHWILNSVPPCNLHWRGVQWCCPSYHQGDNHKLEQTDGWSTTERLMGSSKVERTPPPWPRKGGNHCGHQHYLFLLHDTKQCIPKDRKMMILIRFASKLMAIWLTIRMSSPSEQPTWYPPKSRGTSVISTPSAKFGGADIENMYLETPLDWYEYMKMPLKILPDNVIAHYNTRHLHLRTPTSWHSDSGEQNSPKERLAWHGYFKVPHTPGIRKYISCPL